MGKYRERQVNLTTYTRLARVDVSFAVAGGAVDISMFEEEVTETAVDAVASIRSLGVLSLRVTADYEIPLLDANGAPTGNTMKLKRVVDALKDLYAATAAARDSAPDPMIEGVLPNGLI